MKMFQHLRRIRGNEHGVGAVEFAMIAPLLLTFIIGVAQLGTLFMANATLRSSVAEGARLATVYRSDQTSKRPPDTDIIARITERSGNLRTQNVTGPTITTATDGSSLTITMSYAVPLNFIFFQASPVTLTETRTVPLHTDTTSGTTTTTPTSAGGTTTPTTSGGTTTPTTSGGTTTPTTTGGTTTPTTTGGTTTPTTTGGTTTPTTTGGTNSSNGGSNNSNGGGHGHGSNGGSNNSNGGH